MEKSQYCLRITAHWDSDVVYSKRDFLRMEVVRSDFSAVGQWQTSVVLYQYPFSETGTDCFPDL